MALAAIFWVAVGGCSRPESGASGTAKATTDTTGAALVTFVELGSVNCIPCRQMQPIMESIERKYGSQIKVVFHDVWKDPTPGRKYGIRLIPTQVFLDADQQEIARHEGFLPEARIDELLQSRGLKILTPEAGG